MRRPTLRTSKVLDREPPTILFSSEALQATLLRLQNEWATVQASRDRDAIYRYLVAVFEVVGWWDEEGKAVKRAHRALHLRGYSSVREPEPFAAIICAPPIQLKSMTGHAACGRGCYGMWLSTRTWMSRCVSLSRVGAVSMHARHGLPGVWGEASIEAQRVCSREIGFESCCPTH